MKLFSNMTKKKLALMLAAVFLVSGTISTMLVFGQMIPDIQEQLAWERGLITDGSGSGLWQEYQEDWQFALAETDSLSVNLHSVYVEIVPAERTGVYAQFTGQVKPNKDGSLPVIVGSKADGGFQFSHSRNQNRSFWGSTSSIEMRGTLRIELPKDLLLHLDVEQYAGSVSVQNVEASSLNISTSSGNIQVANVHSRANIELGTYSGNVAVSGLSATELIVSTSSGKLEGERIDVENMRHNTYSGSVELERVTAEEMIRVTTSSSKVTLVEAVATDVVVDTFSGSVTLKEVSAGTDINVQTSSGKIQLDDVSGKNANLYTFSGSVDLSDTTLRILYIETSSGKVTAALLEGADIHCSTFSGKVELIMPKDYTFTVSLDTFSGKLDVQYPMTVTSGDIGKSDLKATVGAGLYNVVVSTSSGNITIRPSAE